MALKACSECGGEVSSKAKSCPKCGAKVKKRFGIVAVLGGLFLVGIIVSAMGENSGSQASVENGDALSQTSVENGDALAATALPEPINPKNVALEAVKIKDYDWYKGGFDSVMMINVTFENTGQRDVKDLEITCTHSSNSGTEIDENKKTIYEVVKAGKTKSVKNFNMGFINAQAATTSCAISDLTLA